MTTIFRHTLFQIYHHRVRMYLFLIVFGCTLLSYTRGTVEGLNGITSWFVWVLGAGLIGKDIAAGTLHLWITRPLVRYQYVLAKWLALSAASAAAGGVHLALGVIILGTCFHKAPPLPAVGMAAIIILTTALSMSAMVAAFSCILRGMGDLALWFGVWLAASLSTWILELNKIHTELFSYFTQSLFAPGSQLADSLQNGAWNTPHWAAFVFVTAGFLSLASWLMNRKEFSYGNG
jgi:ABC-type transport system involved in multi-copper enzyme maturation permease subunit